MRDTQPIPRCPQCNARVHRTHTCRASGLTQFSLPENARPAITAPPLQLVPMPEGWRDQALAVAGLARAREQLTEDVATWPRRAQLELVTDDELADHIEDADLVGADDWRDQ